MLQQGNTQGFLSFADQRIEKLRFQGRDTVETEHVRDLVASGQSGIALQRLQAFTGVVERVKGITVGKEQRVVDPTTGEVIFEPEIPVDPTTGEVIFEPEIPVEPEITEADKFTRSEKIRKEITANTKEFVKVRDSFGRIKVAQDSPAGDISLVFNFMKMLDPGSVVREGEFATAAEAEGVPGRILNTYNRLLTGERLTPKQRKDFASQAGKLFGSAKKGAKRVVDQRLSIGKRFGLTRQDVFGEVDFFEPQETPDDTVSGLQQPTQVGRFQVEIETP
jgi:hypothetical protein